VEFLVVGANGQKDRAENDEIKPQSDRSAISFGVESEHAYVFSYDQSYDDLDLFSLHPRTNAPKSTVENHRFHQAMTKNYECRRRV